MQKVSEALHSYDQAGKNSNVKNVLMAETTGGDIFVGDIIKLRQGESCPCDMLILATSTFLHNSQVCTVDSMYDDGKCNRQVKYGVSLTKSFNHLTHTDNQTDIKKFLKLLYARVEYHRISDTHKITGTFKLKADPRVEQFDNKNTIDKGSILKSSYIYGLVLYNGMNCLDARTTSSIYLTKSSGVESKMKIFSLSMIFLNLIFCILFTIGFGRVRLRGGRELNTFFEPNTFVSFVSLLFSAMPMTASILLNVFYATSAFILQRQYRGYINSEEFKQVTQGVDQSQVETQGTLNHNASKAAEFKNSFKILNPNVIPDLGDVDDAFFDKTGTISSNSYVVESIATRSKIYGCKNTSFNPKNLAIIDPEKSIQKDNNTDKSVLKNRLEAGDGNFEPTLNSKRSVKHEVPKWDFKTRVMGATPFDSPETESLKEHDTPPVNGSSLLTVSRMNNVDLKSMSKFQKAINIHSKNNLSQSDKLKQTQSQPAQKFDPNIIHTPEDFETDFKYTSEIKELLLMFATCHKATAHDNTFESDNIEERALLRLASQYHINFEKNIIREDSVSSKTPSQKAQPLNYYLIRDRHKVASKTSYYFISEYDPDRKRFSILIRDNKAGEAVLYVRGTNDSMRGLLNFTDPAGMSQYDSVIEHNTKRGLRPVVFATRRMTLEEADKHYNEYMAISRSSLDQEGRMATLNKNLETNLTFMAVVGFKNMVKNDSLVTFEYLKEMGVNVHMLSGDNKEHCMMAVHSLNLLSSKDRYIELNFVNVDAGRSQIKRALDEVGKNLEKTLDEEKLLTNEEKKDLRRSDTLSVESLVNSKNLFIVISGAALDVIFTDKYLYEHTKFIFEFAKTLVGYSLSPNNKASIVKIFKSLERVTMAVGDGFNDVNMIQASHVGFQMVSPNVGYQFGDILINNIYSIPVAMNRRCRSWNDNLHIAIHNLYKYSLTLLIISGLYQIYCLISGAPILSSYLFLTAMFFMVPLVTIFVFFNERYSPAFRSTVKGLYSEKNYLTRAVGFRVLCFHLLPECFVEGAVILIISLHSLHSNIRELGFLETKEQLTLLITLLAYLAFCFNNIICCEHKRLMMTVVSVLVLALMFLVLYILFEIRLYTVNYQVAIVVFVDNWNTMMLLLILALLILMISNGVWTVFSHPKYYPVYHIIQRSIAYQNREVLDSLAPEKNELFLNLYKHTDPFTATFKKCFSDKSEVNIVLTNLMLPSSGAFDNSISGWAMKLRSKMLYKKYMIYASKRFIRIMRVALGVGTVGLFIYLLLTALLDKFSTGQTAWVNSFIFILLPLLYYFSFDTKWALKINTYAILFQLCLVVSSILYCLSYRTDYSILGSLVLIFLSLHYNVEFSVFFCLAIISLVGYALTFLANIASIRESAWGGDGIIFPLISISFEYFGITLAVIIQRRKNERLIKEEFITGADLDSTAVLAKNLLALLLPKFVMDRMKNFLEISGEKQVFDDEDKVAIMFCDIADFDDVVRKNENNIVHLLHKIFRRFDDLCIIHGVQKIETVGKTYMAAAGLKAVESGLPQDISKINPTLRILNFCKDMMTIIKDYEGLKLKIGVHVGRPVVGVIGYHKPQFSLIGDVVNTTSRHCTTGDKGHIMLSEAAWAEVKDKLPLSMGYAMETKQAFMKGKGNVDVYHLFEKKNLFLAFIKSIAQNKDNLREPNLYIQAETLHRALEAIRKRNRFADLKIFKLLEQIKTGNLLKDLYKDVNLKASMNFPANTQDSDMKNQRALLGDRTNSRKYTDKIISDSSQLIDNGLKKTETEDLDEQEDEDKNETLKPGFTLDFKASQSDLVRKYNDNLRENNYNNLRIFFAILCCEYALQIILHIIFSNALEGIQQNAISWNVYISVILLAACLLLTLLVLLTPGYYYSVYGRRVYMAIFIIIPVMVGASCILIEGFSRMYYSHIIALNFTLMYFVCLQSCVLPFMYSACYFGYLFLVYLFFYIYQYINYIKNFKGGPRESTRVALVAYLIYFFLCSFFTLLNNYIRINAEVSAFNNIHLGAKNTAKIKEFVDRLLPKHVRESLDSSEVVAETLENVTLLFADIVGFTEYSSTRAPTEVVEMLSNLFTSFDKECNKLNLYKVYTIGDCYVVMSFLDKNNRISPDRECINVVELAFKMIEIIARVRKEVKFDGLHMRIGIHTGRIIGGLMGTGIVRYDLYGRDVLIANKMESSGQHDAVHISKATKDMLEKSSIKKFTYREDEPVDINALHIKVDTYFIENEKNAN